MSIKSSINKRNLKQSILKNYVHDSNVTKADVKKISVFMLEQSVENLMRLIKNPDTPIFVTGFASALLKDLKAGSVAAINILLEWGFGKPDQTIISEGSVTQTIIDLSIEERANTRNELLKKMGWTPPSNLEQTIKDIVTTENSDTIPQEVEQGENEKTLQTFDSVKETFQKVGHNEDEIFRLNNTDKTDDQKKDFKKMLNNRYRKNTEFKIDNKFIIMLTPYGNLYEKDISTGSIRKLPYIYDKEKMMLFTTLHGGQKFTIISDGVDLSIDGHIIEKIKDK